MPILRKTDIAAADILDEYIKNVRKAKTETEKLQKKVRAMNKDGSGSNAKKHVELTQKLTSSTKKLKNAYTDEERVRQQVLKANIKLAESRTKEARQLALIKQKTTEQNRVLREQAKAQLGVKKSNNGLISSFKNMAIKIVGVLAIIQGLKAAFNLLKKTISSTAEGQLFLAKVTGATDAVMASFTDQIYNAGKSLIKFSTETKKSKTWLQRLGSYLRNWYKVRGKGFLKFFSSASKFMKGEFKEGLKNVNDGFVQMTIGIERATKKTKGFLDNIKIMAGFGAAISVSLKNLELKRSEYAIQEAKDLARIANLRIKIADKTKYSAEERIKFSKEAISIQKKIGDKNLFYAKQELNLQKAIFFAHHSNIDDEIKLNELKKNYVNIDISNSLKLKKLIAERVTAEREGGEKIKANKRKNSDEVQLIKSKAAHVELTDAMKLEDEKTRIKDEGSKKDEERRKREKKKKEEAAKEELDRLKRINAAKAKIKNAAETAINKFANDIFNASQDEKLAQLQSDSDSEKKILQDQLDKGEISQKDFTKKVADINKRQRIIEAKAEKKKSLFEISIATIVASIKVLPDFIAAAAILIAGGIAAAAVAAKPIPKFAKGEINIKGKSHKKGGILSTIEGGESIINKKATADSQNILKAINSGMLTDKSYSKISQKDNNLLLAGLLMQSNKTNNEILTALLNGKNQVIRGNENIIYGLDGTIERFINE